MFKKEQKEEALKRMKLLGLHENAINEFDEENKLNLSETMGALYWLNDKEKQIIKEFEEENGGLVYHIIHNFTEFGELYSIFYVSKHQEEWEMDIEYIKENLSVVYVKNVDDMFCSEFGTIGFKTLNGGLVRIY